MLTLSHSVYIPPRQAWDQGAGGRNSPRVPSPMSVPGRIAELPPSPGPAAQPPAPASEYYEDVAPRFAGTEEPPARRSTPPPTNSNEDIPQGARSPAESEHSTFTSISQRGINPRWNPASPPPAMPGSGAGAGGGGYYSGNVIIPRRPVNRPTDMLLNSNPDFQLPTRGTGQRGPASAAAAAAMIPGSAYPARPL